MIGKHHRSTRFMLWVLLIGCLLILSKFILFKNSPHYYKHYFKHEYSKKVIDRGWQNANWKAFSTIRLFYRSRMSADIKYKNLGGNVIGFIPLGILLPLLFMKRGSWWKTILAVFLISLFFEITQLLTGLGVFDVDDLILNTAGGIIGYLLYVAGTIVFRERTEARVVVN